ncbi:helix-turn-helix transcriptional regulator [Chelatococcus reniformis]|uniref:HTH araC/xylS-type domain-containing protein n=1 Tax=Chelatococcus reniformis TaxID=1494448 RepID=A0A916X815_9HYPH|nr:AraC family transcriptional regulator [Chelatococcus reniformis]GGC45946.1 hypothetical protein GCM10010994_01330 [Chelatococcus reniformis]
MLNPDGPPAASTDRSSASDPPKSAPGDRMPLAANAPRSIPPARTARRSGRASSAAPRRLADPSRAAGGEIAPVNALPNWRLKRITAYVDEHIGEPLPLLDLAKTAGLSRMYFAAQFRAATGLRPHEYVLRRRLDHAQGLLARTAEPIVAIALSVGFHTQAHFTTVFKRFVGETPAQWRALNRPHDIGGRAATSAKLD